MHLRLLVFGPILSIAAMVSICGGQRLALQSVAWTGMLIEYSQHASLAEAVAETFDGAHPCNICKGLQQEKKTGQEQDLPVEKEWDIKFFTTQRAQILYPPTSFDLQPVVRQKALTCAEAPPVPPPRGTGQLAS